MLSINPDKMQNCNIFYITTSMGMSYHQLSYLIAKYSMFSPHISRPEVSFRNQNMAVAMTTMLRSEQINSVHWICEPWHVSNHDQEKQATGIEGNGISYICPTLNMAPYTMSTHAFSCQSEFCHIIKWRHPLFVQSRAAIVTSQLTINCLSAAKFSV